MAEPVAPPPPAANPPPAGVPPGWEEPAALPTPVANLELKALLLLLFTLALVTAAALYVMYSRGVFEPKQSVVLVTDNSEGVSPGMDMLFSGFPIGRVRSVELGENANVRITVDVPRRDGKWLRTSSVFTLVRGLVGGAQLRAYTGVLTDPPLPDGAERPVLRGDVNADIQRMIGTARDVLENLNQMSSSGSDVQKTLGNLQAFTAKLQGRQGALHAVFGNEDDARKLVATLERANAAIARVEQLAAHADQQVFGRDGLTSDARATVRELQGVLADARNSMKRVDAVLQEVQGIGANVRTGTEDLGSLRQEVEANLRKVEDLLNDINRKWPLAKDRKVELP